MSTLLQLCKIDDVSEGQPRAVAVPSLPMLAVYEVGGEYFVTDDLCTHGNASLADGYQDGGVIECPFHGGAFDIRTGAPTAFPCQLAIRTYPVTVQDGWISIAAPASEPSEEA